MGETVQEMLKEIMPAILSSNRETLKEIRDKDDLVDLLYAQIIDYMGRISKRTLTEQQTNEFMGLMEAVTALENIGDTIETNLVVLGNERIEAGVSISKPTRKVLSDFHLVIERALDTAIQAVSQGNQEAAKLVIDAEGDIKTGGLPQPRIRQHGWWPKSRTGYRLGTIEIDIIEKQKRIYYFAKRMAKTVFTLGEDPRDGRHLGYLFQLTRMSVF